MNKTLDVTALTIGIIGAVNWGLIGFFNFNLVQFLLGSGEQRGSSMHWWDYAGCIFLPFT